MTQPDDRELENEIEGLLTSWDEGEEDPESLMGEELSDEEIRASFDDDDEDLTEEVTTDTDDDDDDLLEEVNTELRAASWHVAPSLLRFKAEINKRWPKRDKASDGSIGDAAHSSRSSDHNPNGRRSVNAIDIDKDGISPMTLVNAAKKHPSTNYIIWNRVIYSRSRGFRGVRYTGSNPHNHHLHVSIRQSSAAEQSKKGWGVASATTTPAPAPKPSTAPAYPGRVQKSGSTGEAVKTIQRRLNTRGYTPKLSVDGEYGPATIRNVKAFQRFSFIKQHGEVGPVTWKMLWSKPIT